MAEWKITLPKNPVSREDLRYKLCDYDQRLAEMAKENPYPYFLPEDIAATFTGYKFAILHRLLRKGEVDVHMLFDDLEGRCGIRDIGEYFEAARVIEDYCKTGGKNVINGTGLKSVKVA